MEIDILDFKKKNLETKRLLLVPFSLRYKDFFYNCSKNKAITKYTTIIGSIEKPTLTDVEKYIKKTKRNKKGLFYIILLKENKKPIGCVGINKIDPINKSCTTFSWLDSAFWSNGYMSEAKKEIIAFAFNKLFIRRIETDCIKENKKIIKHLSSLGFKKEGLLREKFLYKNKYRDEIMFALLKKEYKKN